MSWRSRVTKLASICSSVVFAVMLLAINAKAFDRVDGSGIAYDVFGTGAEKVVVMHEWLGDWHNYDTIRPYLDTENFQFAFVDLRGYGNSMHVTGQVFHDRSGQRRDFGGQSVGLG